MKKSIYISLGLLLLTGCAGENKKGEEARKEYASSLDTEIAQTKSVEDSCRDAAAVLGDEINNLLRDFVPVNNSREVTGYTIFQGWQSRYPLKSTGFVARMSDGGAFELIAALSAGVFDRIRVSSGTESAETAIVPNDQALNYRREGLTTVLFSGPEANEVGRLIMDNELNPLTVTFLNGGKTTGTWKIPNENAKMISMTAMLTSRMAERNRIEKRGMLMAERLKLLRQHRHEGEKVIEP